MKIIQITDSHIRNNAEDLVYGTNPRKKLQLIAEYILEKENNYDCIFLTGDISDDGSINSYQYVASLFEKMNKKIYYINGNHDEKQNLISVFSSKKFLYHLQEILIGNWLFIGLDSCLVGKAHGFLSEQELERFETLVHKAKVNNYNCVVVTHHHPQSVGTPLIDDCTLVNSSELISILEKNKLIKLLITGHVHNHYSIKITNHATLETGPSTFAQFKYGGSNELNDIDISKFGYKTYEFLDDSYTAACHWIYE